MDINQAEKLVDMPGDKKFMVGCVLIILTIYGMYIKTEIDKNTLQERVTTAETQKGQIKKEGDSVIYVISMQYERKYQLLLMDRIDKSNERERWMDSTIKSLNATMIIQKNTLKR